MKRLFAILFFLLPLAAMAANPAVRFYLTDFEQGPASYRSIKLTPTNAPYSAGGTNPTIHAEPRLLQFNAQGVAIASNMAPLIYRVEFPSDLPTTRYYITVPDTNGIVNEGDISSVRTNQPSNVLSAYSIASANARFIVRPTTATNGQFLATPDGTNWYGSNVTASSAVTVGASLYVSTNGNDSTALRGVLTKPFLTLGAAKTNALAGDTIQVLPGLYNERDFAKNGVNCFFFPGSKAVWTNDPAQVSGTGFFDDRLTGAITNKIEGWGDFFFHNDENTSCFGAFFLTNALSDVSLHCNKIYFEDMRSDAVFGGVSAKNCRFFDVHANEIADNSYNQAVSYASAIYWEAGEMHVTADRIISDNGYGVWAKEPSQGTTNSLWVTANQILGAVPVSGVGVIEITALTDQYRVWIDAKEIAAGRSGSIVVHQTGGGRVYIRTEKLTGPSQTCVVLTGGNLWLDVQKLASGSGWLNVTGGFLWANIGHFDQTGNLSQGMTFSGGSNYVRGGFAITTNAPVVKWTGGQTFLDGLVLQEFNPGAVATNASIWSFAAAGSLTLKNCTLLGGGTNSIYATNAQTVGIEGTLNPTNAINPNVTITGSSQGYTLYLACTVTGSLADSTTYYPMDVMAALNTAYTNAFVRIPHGGTIKSWDFRVRNVGVASSETVSHFLRINDSFTCGQIDTTYVTTNVTASVTLNQRVKAGDTVTVQVNTPAWVTNPTSTRFTAQIYIETP